MGERDQWQALADLLDVWPTRAAAAAAGSALAVATVDDHCVRVTMFDKEPIRVLPREPVCVA